MSLIRPDCLRPSSIYSVYACVCVCLGSGCLLYGFIELSLSHRLAATPRAVVTGGCVLNHPGLTTDTLGQRQENIEKCVESRCRYIA